MSRENDSPLDPPIAHAWRGVVREACAAEPMVPSVELRERLLAELAASESISTSSAPFSSQPRSDAMTVSLPKKDKSAEKRSFWTIKRLVEYSVVVCIAGVFIGLLMPAVHVKREYSSRAEARHAEFAKVKSATPRIQSGQKFDTTSAEPSANFLMESMDPQPVTNLPVPGSATESFDDTPVHPSGLPGKSRPPIGLELNGRNTNAPGPPSRGVAPADNYEFSRQVANPAPEPFADTPITYPDAKQWAELTTKRQREMREREGKFSEAVGNHSEQYDAIRDNPFYNVKKQPLSTFGIDVDTASYANVRRFLNDGQLPPRDAVRIEELVNYFKFNDPAPTGDAPFSANMEAAPCPWNNEHLLLRVGLKGKEIHREQRPPSNLVFLIDVSGSMADDKKLPLLQSSLKMLVEQLTEDDTVSIVTYAGSTGVHLKPTNGTDKTKLKDAIDRLNSGGSTHGSAGIVLAYEQARQGFIHQGTNRVILCTDGDLNVGVTRDEDLVQLITKEAKSNVFLTVLGFGTGNLKDSKMEKLADHGNGLYAYIDSLREGHKVLVEQMSGSLVTIAKDVKIQIEFNPAQVAAYRLIGYENRLLAAKDFNDDQKDAGEIGAGHSVTALYELVPLGKPPVQGAVDPLKYQPSAADETQDKIASASVSHELLTLKLRYKQPDGETSKLLEFVLSDRKSRFGEASSDFRFASSVAAFGMNLRQSPYRGELALAGIAEIAATAVGDDRHGHRAEFLDLIRKAAALGAK